MGQGFLLVSRSPLFTLSSFLSGSVTKRTGNWERKPLSIFLLHQPTLAVTSNCIFKNSKTNVEPGIVLTPAIPATQEAEIWRVAI
jgi:hypothetical protein